MQREALRFPLHTVSWNWRNNKDLQLDGYDLKDWTHREVWDLITMDGDAADPRDVPVIVESLTCQAGTPMTADGCVCMAHARP